MKKILVTGIAGFIGYHLAKALVKKGYCVIGIDNLNDYYSPILKLDRLKDLGIEVDLKLRDNRCIESVKYNDNLIFFRMNIEEEKVVAQLFNDYNFDIVCHLAAQAGVRYSIQNPRAYIESNIIGFFNIIESVRQSGVGHFVYASSSSVYGLNETVPFHVDQKVDNPISLYAATKKSNELIAHVYSHLHQLKTTGLRFFTVYGPWGRPDMAPHLFASSIINNKEIKVFNHGNLYRDFTYIDDIINGILIILNPEENCPRKNYEIYNIGSGNPQSLELFISLLEGALGKVSKKEYTDMQAGDVYSTWADIDGISKRGYANGVSLNEGVNQFVQWFKNYYKTK